MKKLSIKSVIVAIFALIFISANTIYYVSTEQPLYSWDFVTYWKTFNRLSPIFSDNVLAWLVIILREIDLSIYNPSPIVPLLPFYYLFGDDRTGYILAISVVYLFTLSLTLARDATNSDLLRLRGYFIFVLLIVVTYVPFWRPVLRGYPDIVGLLPILWAIKQVIEKDLTKKISVKSAILLGLLLWMPFLFRRWYVYTVISLFMTLPILNVYLHALPTARLQHFIKAYLNFFVAGLSTLACLFIFQQTLTIGILTGNYYEAYSAYSGALIDYIWQFIHYLGLFMLPPFAIGLAVSLRRPKTIYGKFGLFCLANLILSFLLFSTIQLPYIQHQLPFALWVLFISLIGIGQIITIISNYRIKLLTMAAIVAVFAYVMLVTFYRASAGWRIEAPIVGTENHIFRFVANPDERGLVRWLPTPSYGLHFDNYDHYLEMSDVIMRLTDNGDKLTVLSSSEFLSDSMLVTISQGKLSGRIQATPHVDLRDRLFLAVFQTKYLLVTDPVQYHLDPKDQRTIGIPAGELLMHRGIGLAYHKLPYDFVLDNGIHAYIYQKMRPFSPQEAQDFLNVFIDAYPQWQSDYGNGTAVAYLVTGIENDAQ